MTNGDGIRQLNNEELAYLICGFIALTKYNILIQKSSCENVDMNNIKNNKEYQVLLELLNERVDCDD